MEWVYPLRERFDLENTTLAGRISAKERVNGAEMFSEREKDTANPYSWSIHFPVVPRFRHDDLSDAQ